MNTVSRTITGACAMILGVFLAVVAILESAWVLIYAIPIFLIGVFIFFNKNEDVIEEIKNEN